MLNRETYNVDSATLFDIEIAPGPADGKKHPIVILVHGNFGLLAPFGDQLRSFTEEVSTYGYVTALPSYYPRDRSNPNDQNIAAHVPALSAAVAHVSVRSDVDPTRLGIIGFSLGCGIAMSFIQSSPAGTVSVLADFYGFVRPLLDAGVAKFPPTIIFHNAADPIVRVGENSEPLADALEAASITHVPVRPYAGKWYNDNLGDGRASRF